MNLLYELLQIPSFPKRNIFKRIKTYFKVRKIKKMIKNDIHNWSSFFENIVDYCAFMEHVDTNFQIPKSDNYYCKTIPYNNTLTTYIMQFVTSAFDGCDAQVTLVYKTDEPDRLNVKIKAKLMYNEIGYDIYLESDKLDSYKNDKLKNEIVLFTMDYMNNVIEITLDAILNKYTFQRKEKDNDEKEV